MLRRGDNALAGGDFPDGLEVGDHRFLEISRLRVLANPAHLLGGKNEKQQRGYR